MTERSRSGEVRPRLFLVSRAVSCCDGATMTRGGRMVFNTCCNNNILIVRDFYHDLFPPSLPPFPPSLLSLWVTSHFRHRAVVTTRITCGYQSRDLIAGWLAVFSLSTAAGATCGTGVLVEHLPSFYYDTTGVVILSTNQYSLSFSLLFC